MRLHHLAADSEDYRQARSHLLWWHIDARRARPHLIYGRVNLACGDGTVPGVPRSPWGTHVVREACIAGSVGAAVRQAAPVAAGVV